MSSLASVELAHSPQDLAGLIDRELADIAGHLPDGIMTSQLGSGTVHEIHTTSDVGTLKVMYLGFLAGQGDLGRLFNEDSPYDRYAGIRVIAQDHHAAIGFWQDFALDYWHRPLVITPTSAEDVAEHREDFSAISFLVQSLHHSYMVEALDQPNVVSLTEHVRTR
ncbi:hypothetical protein BH09PAT4_BH09PAT4_02280 [soil metagenome]